MGNDATFWGYRGSAAVFSSKIISFRSANADFFNVGPKLYLIQSRWWDATHPIQLNGNIGTSPSNGSFCVVTPQNLNPSPLYDSRNLGIPEWER